MQMHLEIITRSERCCSKFLFPSQKSFAKCDEHVDRFHVQGVWGTRQQTSPV
jgi:hypothetical protein